MNDKDLAPLVCLRQNAQGSPGNGFAANPTVQITVEPHREFIVSVAVGNTSEGATLAITCDGGTVLRVGAELGSTRYTVDGRVSQVQLLTGAAGGFVNAWPL